MGHPEGAAPTGLPAEALRSLPDLLRFAGKGRVLDLALGIPPGPPPAQAIAGAVEAMRHGRNQYADSRGVPALRHAIAARLGREWSTSIDADRELTITSGVAGGVFCALMAALARGRGDEVIVLDPSFSHHVRTIRLLGGRVVSAPLEPPRWRLDLDALARAFGARTRCVLIANPGNPTGRILDATELTAIARLCVRWGATLIVDEIYADLAFVPRMQPAWGLRSTGVDLVVLRGVSKSLSVSGWRIGFAIAPASITHQLRAVHDASTLGAPTPLQYGVVAALDGTSHTDEHRESYRIARDRIADALAAIGARPAVCDGGIFLCAEVGTAADDDAALTERLLTRSGVLVAPGRMFFADLARGRRFVRVCFARRKETIDDAVERIKMLV